MVHSKIPQKGNDFFQRVYTLVKQIPPGKVASYGTIAKCIGAPGAARMVGWAMNKCHHIDPAIPAHRVVNRNGYLTGKHHFRHPKLMQELLESEGLCVHNDKIKDVDKHFWDPCQDLI